MRDLAYESFSVGMSIGEGLIEGDIEKIKSGAGEFILEEIMGRGIKNLGWIGKLYDTKGDLDNLGDAFDAINLLGELLNIYKKDKRMYLDIIQEIEAQEKQGTPKSNIIVSPADESWAEIIKEYGTLPSESEDFGRYNDPKANNDKQNNIISDKYSDTIIRSNRVQAQNKQLLKNSSSVQLDTDALKKAEQQTNDHIAKIRDERNKKITSYVSEKVKTKNINIPEDFIRDVIDNLSDDVIEALSLDQIQDEVIKQYSRELESKETNYYHKNSFTNNNQGTSSNAFLQKNNEVEWIHTDTGSYPKDKYNQLSGNNLEYSDPNAPEEVEAILYTFPEEKIEAAKESRQKLHEALLEQEDEHNAIVDERQAQREAELAEKRAEADALELETVEQKTQAMMAAYDTLHKGIADLMGEQAANNEVMAVFSKSLAMFDIGVNSAKAISNATASAKGATAFDYVLQVAMAVGTVMSNIARARKLLTSEKQPKAPKMATGGLVKGPGSGTSDSVLARLSNGESVLTAAATSLFGPTLSAFNQLGGGVPISTANIASQISGEDMLVRSFARALEQMPNPVVSVEEINNTNKRIQVLEQYRTL
ncbi:hypothetical protein [Dysgonomonas sp. 520]|uniref:hypothetical protein n=1 Tax=Dysgonomonas sp. 520 TaxID=2302931 RepID=UPI0013D441ED|nr:hypothetical protein [Dysgonomonas sp. 520]